MSKEMACPKQLRTCRRSCVVLTTNQGTRKVCKRSSPNCYTCCDIHGLIVESNRAIRVQCQITFWGA